MISYRIALHTRNEWDAGIPIHRHGCSARENGNVKRHGPWKNNWKDTWYAYWDTNTYEITKKPLLKLSTAFRNFKTRIVCVLYHLQLIPMPLRTTPTKQKRHPSWTVSYATLVPHLFWAPTANSLGTIVKWAPWEINLPQGIAKPWETRSQHWGLSKDRISI